MDQASARINCAVPSVIVLINDDVVAFKVSKAIKININSPAYKLPKSRNAKEMGLAISPTNSNNKLNGMNSG